MGYYLVFKGINMKSSTENFESTNKLLKYVKHHLANVTGRPAPILEPQAFDSTFVKGITSLLNSCDVDSELVNRIQNALEGNAPGGTYNGVNIRNNVESLKKIKTTYNQLHSDHQKYVKEEKLISKMELRAHTRYLIARILTTLGIGISIMGVYALAQWLEIPMPLMKLPA